MLIKRIDHPIICVRERGPMVAAFKRVLELEPLHAREGDEWGFSNAEIAVGDGLVGVVEPAGADSQLSRFLAAQGDGFYAMAVDVGGLPGLTAAAAHFAAAGVPAREAKRDGETRLLWVPPKAACGVLYQVTPGMEQLPATNPLYVGISEYLVAVTDAQAAVDTYRRVFGFETATPVDDAGLGAKGFRLPIPGSALKESVTLAQPSSPDGALGRHLVARGEGLFQFTIAVEDLAAEVARLRGAGIRFTTHGDRVRIDPAELLGIRIELAPA
jgi:methylmalonyl-CoA/ethylmalonyl-CoA epimerase